MWAVSYTNITDEVNDMLIKTWQKQKQMATCSVPDTRDQTAREFQDSEVRQECSKVI